MKIKSAFRVFNFAFKKKIIVPIKAKTTTDPRPNEKE